MADSPLLWLMEVKPKKALLKPIPTQPQGGGVAPVQAASQTSGGATGGATDRQATSVTPGDGGGGGSQPPSGPSPWAPGTGTTPGTGSNVPNPPAPGHTTPTPTGPFAGAPPGVLQTDEEYIIYFRNTYGRQPFPEEVMGRKLMYPATFENAGGGNAGSYDAEGGNTGGEGGGGGGEGEAGVTPEVLGDLAWWPVKESIQPLLRGWGSWLRETVEGNRLNAPSNPFDINEELTTNTDRGPVMPGYKSSSEVLKEVQNRLGIKFNEGDDLTKKWQQFINKIPTADLETQQLLASLRYDANTNSWNSQDVSMFVNPKYL